MKCVHVCMRLHMEKMCTPLYEPSLTPKHHAKTQDYSLYTVHIYLVSSY